jgi:site-specific DNA-cytosine methylase
MDSEYKEFIETSIKFDDDIDIVIGVPICSGLSLANCSTTGSKARGANAEQNNNMYNIAELSLSKIKPKCYIFENAPGLYTKMGEPVVDKLYRIGKKYGYSMSLIKTDTFLHGIPQHRKRTFGIF